MLKFNILSFFFLLLCLNVQAQETTDSLKAPKMVFEKYSHDFGDIVQGDIVSHTFKFTNQGNDTLKVTRAIGSCGCTAAATDVSKTYPPGAKGEIEVTFKSEGKSGLQNKDVAVFSNQKEQVTLKIRVNIIPPKNASSASKNSSKPK